ncbi:MAG: roadblock/LC7 domain-containing protein [Planctomycetota bacterium]
MSDPKEAAGAEEQTIYFAREIHQMNLMLGKFLQKSGADTVLLVDEVGHLVARQGARSPASEDTITALVAGMFSASHAMAQMLGAEEFSSFISVGGGGNLLLLRAGPRELLAVAFREDCAVTLVRTYALEVVRMLARILARTTEARSQDSEIEGERFDSEIGDVLSDVFG